MSEDDLRLAGLRVTGPRLKVLAVLEEYQDNHLSADDVYRTLLEAGEDVGVASVYRILAQFEAAGMVKRLAFNADRSVYELADEAHHDHMICKHCGTIEEFCDAGLETKLDALAQASGFRPLYHDLNLYGICASCGQGTED
ncbi:MAG: transcriptional repressor [Gammaproteobacteria bacterium SHHR-1]